MPESELEVHKAVMTVKCVDAIRICPTLLKRLRLGGLGSMADVPGGEFLQKVILCNPEKAGKAIAAS